MQKNFRQVCVCVVATLTGPATSQSHIWFDRWDISGGNDEVVASVTDFRGNFYVVGQAENGSNGLDYFLTKFTPIGSREWTRTYDGPAHGDDIPSAISVDNDGNVWVTGASWGGSTAFDFATLKYTPSGDIVFPTTGSGTGYIFHNGAVRTVAATDEGASVEEGDRIVVDMDLALDADGKAYVCGKYRLDDQWDFMSQKYELNGVPSSDWPKLWDSGDEDIPRGISVDGLGKIVVVGYSGDSDDVDVSVLRYNGNGTIVSGWPKFFYTKMVPPYSGSEINQFEEPADVATDADGNIFICGLTATAKPKPWVFEDGGKIPPEAPSDFFTIGLAYDGQIRFLKTWDSEFVGYGDLGLSVAPVLDEAGDAIYAVVTGKAATTTGRPGVITIAYDPGDGSVAWDDLYAPSNTPVRGRHIVSRGRNVYIAGFSQRSANVNQFLHLKYGPGGAWPTVLLSPSTWTGADEGASGAVIRAGHFAVGGFSTQSNAQAAAATGDMGANLVEPSSMQITYGTVIGSPSVSYLYEVDSNRVEIEEATPAFPGGPSAVLVINGFASYSPEITEISLVVKSRATTSGVNQKIEFYDFSNETWVSVDTRPLTTTEEFLDARPLGDPTRFVDDDNAIKARISFYDAGAVSPGWRGVTNQAVWFYVL